MEIKVSEGRTKCVQCWEEYMFSFPNVFISNWKEIVNVHTHYYYFVSLHPIHTLNRTILTVCTTLYMIFSLYPKNFDITKCIKVTTFFILLVIPHHQKKTRIYRTEWHQDINALRKGFDIWSISSHILFEVPSNSEQSIATSDECLVTSN